MKSADYWQGRDDQLKKQRDDSRGSVLMLGAILVLLPVCFWLLPSYFEAKTYRKLTGADVTMWDAMWVELRVQEGTEGH